MSSRVETLYNYLAEKKCKDIAIYDITNEKLSYSYIVILSCNDVAANKNFASSIMQDFGLENFPEGYNKGEWIIFDFEDIILHLFIPAAREKYNLDNDICNAIKYHTIGNKNMDTLAKIIYIADKIGRKEIPKELMPIKDLVKKDLNAALIYFIEKQNKNLISKNITPHKNTEELLQTLKKQNKNS